MSGNTNKTDVESNKNDGMSSLLEPLLEIEPVPIPVPIAMRSDIEIDADMVPLVQSTIVPPGEGGGSRTVDVVQIDIDINESEWDHGEVQPKAYRDCFWAFLFLAQLAVVAVVGIMGIRNFIKSPNLYPADDDDSVTFDRKHAIVFLAVLPCTVIVLPSILINLLLVAFSAMLIQISLLIAPASYIIAFVISISTMNCPIALLSLIMFLVSAYYATKVWHKIPFATANLKVALASIRDNHGLWILAYVSTLKSYAWFFLWGAAAFEMLNFSPNWIYNCTTETPEKDFCSVATQGKFIGIGMLLSLLWTHEVIKNVFHTTVAGVVGTWWFDPEEARSASARGASTGVFGCCGCSTAILDSWTRSGLYSLGSIALGSLLVGILKIISFVVRCGRQQRDQQRRLRGVQGTDFLFCFLQFFVDRLERFLEYFNVWTYVYVGLYGYDYWTAGKQVATLFRARGWDVIITDNLVSRSLSMMTTLIILIMGLVGVLLAFIVDTSWIFVGLFMGIVLGTMSCQILFGVVTSAVNTVVVCFAESPNQLNQNGHDTKHFQELIEGYRKAYPNECGF